MTGLALSTYFLVGKINRLFPSISPPVVCLDSSINVCCYSSVVGSDCAVPQHSQTQPPRITVCLPFCLSLCLSFCRPDQGCFRQTFLWYDSVIYYSENRVNIVNNLCQEHFLLGLPSPGRSDYTIRCSLSPGSNHKLYGHNIQENGFEDWYPLYMKFLAKKMKIHT